MIISFIGAGNVAWHLAQAFENAEHVVNEVYSRDITSARKLATKLYDCRIQPDLNFSDSKSEIFFLATSDNALEEVIERLVLPENAILVHTSGARSLDNLQDLVDIHSDVQVYTGVFYPLQTISRYAELNLNDTPICIESENEFTLERLSILAKAISKQVYEISSEERRVLHVAAVIANNFTNHIMSLAYDVMANENLDFELLAPLIRQTVRIATQGADPGEFQTGPARRGDWKTINNHLAYLQEQSPEWANLYRNINNSIRDKYFGIDD